MSSRCCCRWKIFFLIFSLVFRTPAISFTIGRSSNLTADLLGEESSRLEVKDGFKSTDDRNDNLKVFESLGDSLPSKSSITPAKTTWVSGTTSTVTDSTEPYIMAAVIKPRRSEVSGNLASNNTNEDFTSVLLVNTTETEKNNELSAVTESVTSGSDINEMATLIGVDSTSAYTTEVTNSEKLSMKINGTDTSQSFTNHVEISSDSIDGVDNVYTNKPIEDQFSEKTEKNLTKNTGVTLEEAFGTTSDMTSLEQLKNDFIALTRKLPTENPLYVKGFSVTDPFIITKKIPETTNTISILILTNKTKNLPKLTTPKTSNFDNKSARMGGFLNITSGITNTVEATTSVAYTDATEAKLNETEIYGNMFEMEMENEGVDNKNSSGAESQSQLVDDAIKEELLIEETLSDNKENNHKRLSQENVTEQTLTVKPIPRESDKKFLYTVSPLYKPLSKKVYLPSKPLMRDPDDNRWRNESLSSLGITFNAKNSSKPFTQVLKNKTEMELKKLLEKENKFEEGKQELRKILEKMTELRKSKKKKFDDGTYYNDYEESNVSTETTVKPKSETLAIAAPIETTTSATTTAAYPPNYSFKSRETSTFPATHEYDGYSIHNDVKTTRSPKKFFNAAEYYDANDDGDVDYMTGIDLKKSTTPLGPAARAPPPTTRTMQHLPERKATLQYFPPKTTQKVNINDYDDEFQRKVNSFTVIEAPKKVVPVTSVPATSTARSDGLLKQKQKIMDLTYNPLDLNRDLYLPPTLHGLNQNEGYTIMDRDDNLDKNSYIIKPYSNYFKKVAKEHDSERTTEYIPTFTPVPLRGVTVGDTSQTTKAESSDLRSDYEYDIQFRKDVLDRFADNFNQHSERYKVDFPVIYNNSVIHKKTSEDGKVVASSSAFMRRLYELPSDKYELGYNRPYDPDCDNVTVELSPAYELHYYVPDEEEKEVLDPRSTLTYAFRL